MGGDLNLKKSWHPHLLKNQTRVWQEEKKALEERKQIEKLRREREEERSLEELQKLQEASGGKIVQKRVDWMYGGPGSGADAVTEEREDYLLGKRRIDGLLKAKDTTTSQLQRSSFDTLADSKALSSQDVKTKIAQDPLLMIRKQKMEMELNMARDMKKKSERRDKHRHRRDREERRHRHRHRSRSRSRDRHRRRSRSPERRS